MRKFTLFCALLCGASSVFAQFTTPNDGTTFSLSDFVTAAPDVMTFENDTYTLLKNLTISENDVWKVEDDAVLHIAAGVLVDVYGKIDFNPPNNFYINAVDSTTVYKGFKLQEFSDIMIENTSFRNGGGIQVLTESFHMKNSEVSYQKTVLVTGGAMSFSRGLPVIERSYFYKNQGPAVSSGGNVHVSMRFLNNYLEGNSTANGNRPQINMGPGGADSMIIRGNMIVGDRTLSKVGGIGVSSLMGMQNTFSIEGNTIRNNRYGIGITGANSFGRITGNIIEENNTEGNPMMGGSGISIQAASEPSYVYITRNEIRGNLWGITAIGKAFVNLGSDSDTHPNVGRNVFSGNSNVDGPNAFYNNTPNDVDAKFNCWDEDEDELTRDMIEALVTHKEDNATLGTVDFNEFGCGELLAVGDVNTTTFEMYPNPATDRLMLVSQEAATFEVVNGLGQSVLKGSLNAGENAIPLTLKTGVYFVTVQAGKTTNNQKLVIR